MQKTLYLFQSGRLKRKGNTICVDTEEAKRYFPVTGVRDIFIFGEVDVNKKFLEFAHENEVILHFLAITVSMSAASIPASIIIQAT